MLSLEAISAALLDLEPWQEAVVYGILTVLNLAVILLIFRYLARNPGISRPRPRLRRSQPEDLLEDLADAVLGIDAEDRIVYTNRRVETLFGFSLSELQERKYQELLLLGQGFHENDARKVHDGERAIGIEHEAMGLRKDGSRFDARVTVTPRRRGKIRALVAVREGLPPKPKQAQPSLDAEWLPAVRRIRRFAHLLGRSEGNGRLDRQLVQALQDASEELHAHLNYQSHHQLLLAGKLQPDLQPILISEWLEERTRSCQEEAGRRGIRLRLHLADASDLVILTDEELLGPTLQGLLDFAIRAYEASQLDLHLVHGESSGEAHDSLPRLPDGLAMTGTDRRINLLLLCRPDRESRNASLEPGRGSSLDFSSDPRIRLAEEVVPRLGGGFGFEASETEGLLFQLSFACRSYSGSPSQRAIPALNGNGKADHANGFERTIPAPEDLPRVLCITSGGRITEHLRKAGRNAGFIVEQKSPVEALDYIREEGAADLVILEDGMAEETDFDLTFELRQYRSEKELPILLLRPPGTAEASAQRYSLQVELEYPGNPAELASTVANLCRPKKRTNAVDPT